jgi:hypothetical protein
VYIYIAWDVKRGKAQKRIWEETYESASCEILAALLLKIQVFWDVTLCGWAS